MRKYDVNEIDLAITNVDFFGNDDNVGIDIAWTSTIGFGHLVIYQQQGSEVIQVDTEHMDIPEDKAFTRKLLELLAEKVVITG